MKLFGKTSSETSEKPSQTKERASDSVQTQTKKQSVRVRGTGRSIVLSPLLTEKASLLEAKENAYVFIVHKEANKSEIKKEVERLFNVSVKSVRIVNQSRKRYVWRGHVGFSSGSKKAIVTIADGKKIEILPT